MTMTALAFTKMQGLGNDFVVIDATRTPFTLTRSQVRRLADRRFGVGCDQVLVVEPPRTPQTDFRYRIFNADGGEVEQCGNGARCFVIFVRAKGLTSKRTLAVDTAGGVIHPTLEADGNVTVDMGVPRFRPQDAPFIGVHPNEHVKRVADFMIGYAGQSQSPEGILPVVVTFIETGLVPRLPTAVLAMGLMIVSVLCLTAGVVLDAITIGRRELRRLHYLAIPLFR